MLRGTKASESTSSSAADLFFETSEDSHDEKRLPNFVESRAWVRSNITDIADAYAGSASSCVHSLHNEDGVSHTNLESDGASIPRRSLTSHASL